MIIDFEKALGLFLELRIQELFLDWTPFLQFWNLFYGTFHFLVTIFALVWLYRRFPALYPRWRSAFLCTTGLALVGFSLFPLMPPRLLTDCGEFGGCLDTYPFVDTVSEAGGLWSFDSGTMQKVSNQFAAMPSLHFAWAMWCTLALRPVLRSPFTRGLIVAYPAATLFAVIVTGNHYWADALGAVRCSRCRRAARPDSGRLLAPLDVPEAPEAPALRPPEAISRVGAATVVHSPGLSETLPLHLDSIRTPADLRGLGPAETARPFR